MVYARSRMNSLMLEIPLNGDNKIGGQFNINLISWLGLLVEYVFHLRTSSMGNIPFYDNPVRSFMKYSISIYLLIC